MAGAYIGKKHRTRLTRQYTPDSPGYQEIEGGAAEQTSTRNLRSRNCFHPLVGCSWGLEARIQKYSKEAERATTKTLLYNL